MSHVRNTDEFRSILRRFLHSKGLKATHQRDVVVEAFLSSTQHVSADELYRGISSEHPGIGYATVYRTLKLLKDAGLAAERHFGEGFARYEPLEPGRHHDHLICIGCGTIVEFENPDIEDLQTRVAERHGFSITHHRLELYGHCANCRKNAAAS